MQMKHTAFSNKGLSETKAALSLEKSVKMHLAESPPLSAFSKVKVYTQGCLTFSKVALCCFNLAKHKGM